MTAAITRVENSGVQLTNTQMDLIVQEIGRMAGSMASASTVDLNTTGNQVPITGVVTISSFGSAAPTGCIRCTVFAGSLTLTYGASAIIPPGAVSFITRANDVMWWRHEGSGVWRCFNVFRADGSEWRSFVQFPAVYDNGAAPGATPTIDPTKGSRQKITWSINVTTITITNPPNNLPTGLQLDCYQPAGANYTWPAGGPVGTGAVASKWPANSDKVLTAANAARDRLVADFDGTNWICQLMKGIA